MPAIIVPKDKDDMKTCARHMGVILNRFRVLPPQEREFVMAKLKNELSKPWEPRTCENQSPGQCETGCCSE